LRKGNNDKHRPTLSTANKDDYENKPRKAKHRTLSESTRQSFKLYADTSINQNQADRLYLEQKKNGKLYKVPESNTTTAFDRVLNNYEKVENDIKENKVTNNSNDNNLNKDEANDNENSTLDVTESKQPPVEEIPITEIDKK